MQFSMNTNTMHGFKAKRKKFGFSSMLSLMLFGAIFAAAGGFIYKSMQIDPSWTRVQGSVVDVSSRISDGSTLHTPVIEYTVADQKYRVTGNSSSSAYPTVGGSREVAYNPDQPGQGKAVEGAGSQLFVLAFVVIGIGLFLLAPFLFFRSLKRSRHIDNLMRSGHKLQGVLVDVHSESSNNNSGYSIVVAATDASGLVQNYVSDSMAGLGGLAMADFKTTPIPIDVYVDPTNPQNYYVDISDIPNLTPQRITELVQSALSGQLQNQQPFTTAAPANQPAPVVGTTFAPTAIPVPVQPILPTQPTAPPAAPYEVNR